MNQIIASTNKMRIAHDKDNLYFRINLYHNSDDTNQFKEDLLHFLQIAEAYMPKSIIWDLSQLELLIDVELQTWIDTNINIKEVELGIRKEAFVMPHELINQLSIEQTMDEQFGNHISSRFFPTYEKAPEWILE